MKRVTMELGGHAPAIVFDDADVDTASRLLATAKYRNAGQVCVSPTRMLVQERVYDQFVTGFVQHSKAMKVGDGLESGTTMGPMANPRRITAMETFIGDATQHGATVQAGGHRIGNKGNFFEPTVLTDVPKDARVMNEEPFGPLAVISPFSTFDEVVTEANRLPYGLASYAYTRSAKTANAIAAAVESGMISINHHGLALPEVPFGGVKDSGLRLRRRTGGDRELSQHEVRHPGRPVSRTGTGRRQIVSTAGSPVAIRSAAVPVCRRGDRHLFVAARAGRAGRGRVCRRAGAPHEDLGIQHQPALLHHRNVPFHG